MNGQMKKVREMKSKPWWNYAVILAGVFMFSQSCSMISDGKDLKIAATSIFFAVLLSTYSSRDLTKRVMLKNRKCENAEEDKVKESLKDKATVWGNVAMLFAMTVIALSCYVFKLRISVIYVLNVCAVIINFAVVGIFYKIASSSGGSK